MVQVVSKAWYLRVRHDRIGDTSSGLEARVVFDFARVFAGYVFRVLRYEISCCCGRWLWRRWPAFRLSTGGPGSRVTIPWLVDGSTYDGRLEEPWQQAVAVDFTQYDPVCVPSMSPPVLASTLGAIYFRGCLDDECPGSLLAW
jgi:hypothetical protein